MSAIFLAPTRFAANVLGGTANATAPVSNLLLDHLAMVWQSSAANPYVTLALNGLSIDSVALWGTNMTAADTVRVRLGPNIDGSSPVYDQTFAGTPNIMALLANNVSATYLRLDFARGSGASYTEAARLIVGDRLEVEGISKNAEQTYDDQSIINRGPNWFTVDEYNILQSWRITVEAITEDMFYEANGWHDFISSVGEKRPFVFVPYYPTPYLSKLMCLGTMLNPPKITWITQVDRQVDLAFQSIS